MSSYDIDLLKPVSHNRFTYIEELVNSVRLKVPVDTLDVTGMLSTDAKLFHLLRYVFKFGLGHLVSSFL